MRILVCFGLVFSFSGLCEYFYHQRIRSTPHPSQKPGPVAVLLLKEFTNNEIKACRKRNQEEHRQYVKCLENCKRIADSGLDIFCNCPIRTLRYYLCGWNKSNGG